MSPNETVVSCWSTFCPGWMTFLTPIDDSGPLLQKFTIALNPNPIAYNCSENRLSEQWTFGIAGRYPINRVRALKTMFGTTKDLTQTDSRRYHTHTHTSVTSVLDVTERPHYSKRCLGRHIAERHEADVGSIRVLNATSKLVHNVPQRLCCISSLTNMNRIQHGITNFLQNDAKKITY